MIALAPKRACRGALSGGRADARGVISVKDEDEEEVTGMAAAAGAPPLFLEAVASRRSRARPPYHR